MNGMLSSKPRPFLCASSVAPGRSPYQAWFQSRLERLPRLRHTFLGRRVSSWHTWGAVGLATGTLLFWALAFREQDNLAIAVMVTSLDYACILLIRRASQKIFGYTRGVLLEHFVLILGLNLLILGLLRHPMGSLLDQWIIGVTVFLMFGRIGCLSSGCCHGKPASWGVRYPWLIWKNAPPGLIDLRLLPVQAFESLLLGSLLGGEIILYLLPRHPGEILGFFLAGYAVGRFGLEFLRGDNRPYFLAFSEAQWTCLGVVTSMAIAAFLTPLPIRLPLQIFASGSFGLIVFFSFLARCRLGKPSLLPLSRKHLIELERTIRDGVAVAVAALEIDCTQPVRFSSVTSTGLLIFLQSKALGEHLSLDISLSRRNRPLEHSSVTVAALVMCKVFPDAIEIQWTPENLLSTCFRILTIGSSRADHDSNT